MLDFQNRNITFLVRQDAREPLNMSTTVSHAENTNLITMTHMVMTTGDNSYTNKDILSNAIIYSREFCLTITRSYREKEDKIKGTNSPETSIVVD